MLRLEVELGPLAGLATGDLPGDFAAAFLAYFAPQSTPIRGWSSPPDFLDLLASPKGAPVDSALIEAVLAVETQTLAAAFFAERITFASVEPAPGGAVLVWETADPVLSRSAAEVAVAGFAELAAPSATRSFSSKLEELLDRAGRRRFSASTAMLKAAAVRKGVPCEAVGQHLVLGQGSRQKQLYSSLAGTTSFAAAKLSLDKRHSNRRLASLSLPVPRQVSARDTETAVAALAALGAPAVLKKSKGNPGRGVTVGVQGPEEARIAFARALEQESPVFVEELVEGVDHRLVVVGGRFVAAIATQPAEVTGDGRRRLRDLVEEINSEEDRDNFRLSPVPLDDELDHHLATQGLTLDSVPAKGRVVTLAAHGHVATGGIPRDVTDLVHPDNRELAERAAAAIGLDVAGVDLVMPDIARSYRELGGKILEVNTRPGLPMHAWPRSGSQRDVAGAIVDFLFPAPQDALVPTLVVAGDRGTGMAARHAAELLGTGGTSVGLVLKDGTLVAGRPVDQSASRTGRAARLLRDPTVDALVVARSLRRIEAHGLGLDGCDGVAILRGGISGSKTIGGHDTPSRDPGFEVLLRANRGPFVVPLGDVAARAALDGLDPRRVVLVSEDPHAPGIAAHLDAGGLALLRHWTPKGPRLRLERAGKVLAETDAEGRANARPRALDAKMAAFGLVHALAADSAATERAISARAR